jgi:hypothetical protein
MSGSGVDVGQYYNNGMTWDEFLQNSRENTDRMKKFYEGFEFEEDDVAFFNGRTPLQVLAIAEDWCPDVAQYLSLIARVCDEVPGMELSIVKRDENPDLMDEYLTNGKKRIPVIAFFDMSFGELARWAGRPRAADEWIFGEVLRDRSWEDMSDQERSDFNEEYDRRFHEVYAKATLDELEHLLMDEDF